MCSNKKQLFQSISIIALGVIVVFALTANLHAVQGDTTRVSVAGDGSEGNDHSINPAISGDGRYVVFESGSSNLVGDDSNFSNDIFVHDRSTGQTSMVSVNSGGGQAQGDANSPAISADGLCVAFHTYAANLVSEDTNNKMDVFVHDRVSGETTRVSVDSSGGQSIDNSYFPALSENGRYVAFESTAGNLVVDDTNGFRDVFVHDRDTGSTTRVSVDSAGAEGNDWSTMASISDDGRYVAFESTASNLVAGDSNGSRDVFVHDRSTGSTTRVSVDSTGTQGDRDSRDPSISADGLHVAFYSLARNLVAGDNNNKFDIFVYDRSSETTTRVSVDSTGAEGDGNCSFPAISADGRYVVFRSDSTNLVAGDSNDRNDIFIHDRSTGQTARVSVSTEGDQSDNFSEKSAISSNGRYVVFFSAATNLVSEDNNGKSDIFVHEILGGIWEDVVDLGNGWHWLGWFGYFNLNSDPWVYHQQLGWLYPFGTDMDSITFWHPLMSAFWWTSESSFPYLYRFSDTAWLWYSTWSTAPGWFYNLNTATWESW